MNDKIETVYLENFKNDSLFIQDGYKSFFIYMMMHVSYKAVFFKFIQSLKIFELKIHHVNKKLKINTNK